MERLRPLFRGKSAPAFFRLGERLKRDEDWACLREPPHAPRTSRSWLGACPGRCRGSRAVFFISRRPPGRGAGPIPSRGWRRPSGVPVCAVGVGDPIRCIAPRVDRGETSARRPSLSRTPTPNSSCGCALRGPCLRAAPSLHASSPGGGDRGSTGRGVGRSRGRAGSDGLLPPLPHGTWKPSSSGACPGREGRMDGPREILHRGCCARDRRRNPFHLGQAGSRLRLPPPAAQERSDRGAGLLRPLAGHGGRPGRSGPGSSP